METTVRYFQHKNGSVIGTELVVSEDGLFSSLANTHILTNPDNFDSDPIKGWKEISHEEYAAAVVQQATKVKAAVEKRRKDDKAAKAAAYKEAIDMGFTSKSASTMSGHVP